MSGELGTATMNRRGRVEDFRPATLRPARIPGRINPVTRLQCGVDYYWLGRLCRGSDHTELGDYWYEAVPAGLLIFTSGREGTPRFLPRFEFRTVKQASADYFDAERLAHLNKELTAPPFAWKLGSKGSLCELALSDLPTEIELVVTDERQYRHAGKTFLEDTEPKILGLHQRSVAQIGNALCAMPGSSTEYVDALAAYKLNCWSEQLEVCEKLRATIAECLELAGNALAEEGKLSAILKWLAHGEIPSFLVGAIDRVRALCQASNDVYLQQEFADLPEDIREVVRDFVISEECKAS